MMKTVYSLSARMALDIIFPVTVVTKREIILRGPVLLQMGSLQM